MTREEAINTLGNFKRYISGGGVTDRKANKTIDMAIEALKQEPVKHGEWKYYYFSDINNHMWAGVSVQSASTTNIQSESTVQTAEQI